MLDVTGYKKLLKQADSRQQKAAGESRRESVEAHLQEIEERYLSLFNHSRDAVYFHDFEGNFIDANDVALDLLGYAREDITNLNFTSLLSEDQLPRALDFLAELLETGTQEELAEFKLRCKDGSLTEVETSESVIYRDGQPAYCMGIARNITQRKKLQEDLRTSERMYRLLADNMYDTIWLMDMQLKTTYVSPSSEKLRGFTVQEMLDMGLEQHATPESLQTGLAAFAEEMAKLKENPAHTFSRTIELEFYKKDGSTFWTENTFSLIRDEEGKPAGILGVGRDISERRKSDDRLHRSYDKLQKAMSGAVQTISMISEVRDPYTSGHQQQVAKLAAAIAAEMGLPEKQVNAIRMAGALHDIGKINIPAEILSKPGKLSKIEFDLIRTHPGVGREILKTIDFPWPICKIVLQHHERIDGSGYPDGLAEDDICLEAKILAVADVVDAMTFHRPYRAARGIKEALAEITQNRGILYDPDAVDACLRLYKEKGFKRP
jgi:PAS domain S-box-containing protein/putative nucleotidyltransferase with HDIG domain